MTTRRIIQTKTVVEGRVTEAEVSAPNDSAELLGFILEHTAHTRWDGKKDVFVPLTIIHAQWVIKNWA